LARRRCVRGITAATARDKFEETTMTATRPVKIAALLALGLGIGGCSSNTGRGAAIGAAGGAGLGALGPGSVLGNAAAGAAAGAAGGYIYDQVKNKDND
jgi:hypothetical protein